MSPEDGLFTDALNVEMRGIEELSELREPSPAENAAFKPCQREHSIQSGPTQNQENFLGVQNFRTFDFVTLEFGMPSVLRSRISL